MVTLDNIYTELKALRHEVALFLPLESLGGYANPKKISAAYKRSVSRYPNYFQKVNADN